MLISVFSFSVFYAQSADDVSCFSEEELEYETSASFSEIFLSPLSELLVDYNSETRKEIEANGTSVIIKSNVSGASVFLNGEYFGTTPLSVRNLVPGSYSLKISKKEYETVYRRISVKAGIEYSYYLSLDKKSGWLEIIGAPAGSLIYADGNLLSHDINRLDEGVHSIRIRKFGFRDFEREVFVRADRLKRITVFMETAPFAVTGFSSSKKVFNPDYIGSLGECLFSVSVTAPGSGSLTVQNQAGDVVFSRYLESFSTWTQSVPWNGRDESGMPVSGGRYTAVFSAGGYTFSSVVSVDYSLSYRLLDFTPAGCGAGTVPLALTMPAGTTVVGVSAKGVFDSESGGYAVPLNAALSYNFSDFFEASGIVGFFTKAHEAPVYASFAMKFAFSNSIGSGKFDYGFSLGYGYSSGRQYSPYGIAYGNGLNTALMAGFEWTKVFAGITSQFCMGSSAGNPAAGDDVWKNAIVVSLLPERSISMDLYAAVHSAFGIYTETSDSVENVTEWLNAVESGLGFSAVIPGSSAVFKSGGFFCIFSGGKKYSGFKIALNYLF